MSIAKAVQSALEQLAPFSDSMQSLHVEADGVSVRAELAELVRLAVGFREMTWEVPSLQGANPSRLRECGERIAARVSYLLEPLHPLELDADRCVMQLRSKEPSTTDSALAYYELVIEGRGVAALRRYAKSKGAPRIQTTAHITREVLARLAGDLAAALRM